MFEPVPQKPPHMASHWIMFISAAGGMLGVAAGIWLFGEERFSNSNAVMFGSFAVGALLGLVAGWRIVMPRRPPTEGSQR